MTYSKPYDVTYTQMAIWIDEHAYESDCDESLFYEYLYHLVTMLARNGKFFHCSEDYDNFALTSATKVFLRYRNPKQFQLTDDGEAKLPRIKSVLNYLKNIIHQLRIDFYANLYSVNHQAEYEELDYIDHSSQFRNILVEQIDAFADIDFQVYLQDIIATIRAYLNKIPKKRDSSEWLNIYTSVILSFLNSVTLPNTVNKKIDQLDVSTYKGQKYLNQAFSDIQDDPIILYHLPDTMRSYIELLLKQVKHVIADELSQLLYTYIPSTFDDLANASFEGDLE